MAHRRVMVPDPRLPPSARCNGTCAKPPLTHNPIEWTERFHEAINYLPIIEQVFGLPWCFESLRNNGYFLSTTVQYYQQLLMAEDVRKYNQPPPLFDPDLLNFECTTLRWQMRMAIETCSENINRILGWYRSESPTVFTCHEGDHFHCWFMRLARCEFKNLMVDYENLAYPTMAEITHLRLIQGFTVTKVPRGNDILGCGPMPSHLLHRFRATRNEAEQEDIQEFFASRDPSMYHGPIVVNPTLEPQFSFARALDYGAQIPYANTAQEMEFGPELSRPKRQRSFGGGEWEELEEACLEDGAVAKKDSPWPSPDLAQQ